MHKAEQNVVLGCTDCHGGNPARHLQKEQAHILPKNKQFWNSSANPPNSNAWLNHESPEFIRFINPGDLRVAGQSCGLCHGEIIHNVDHSMMNHGAMLWGAALYNNGAYPEKNYRFGQAYAADGSPLKLINYTPVTPQDVIFSWDLLRQKGRPNHRSYYGKVAKAEQVGERGVRFDLSGADDRELPLILALMPVLAKHAVDPARFEETTFTAPVGSGPYLVNDVDPGKSVTLVRNRAYWGEGLAVNRGMWNFDEVRFEFYRDANVHFDAFKRGLYDVREETDPTRWKTGYDFPAARDGRMIAEALPNGQPKGMEGFVFNARRPLFADVRVREALAMLFDFEWINRNYFFDLYHRTASYFEGSELSARGRQHPIWRGLVLAALAGLCLEVWLTRRLVRGRGIADIGA